MAQQQRQHGGATYMQPESFSGKAKSAFIAANHRRFAQTRGHGFEKRIQRARDARLTSGDPTLAHAPTANHLNDISGARQRQKMVHM
jgi:hypothetical protein